MDSIRENEKLEDMATNLRLELDNDIEHKMCIILVEGSDDVKFCKRVMEKNVIAYESFSGKHDLKRLIMHDKLSDERVIAIRDKDYCELESLPEKMYTYDSCCLETMLLSNSAIKEGLYDTYYGGSDKMDELFDNVIIQLGTISMLRRKQAKENLSINFNKMKLLDCYDDISGILDSKKLFENLGLKDDIYNECKERALHLSITELYENTNGHDLCRILGKIFKAKKGDIGEEMVRNAMICSYRKSDFEETDLYSKLLMYRQNYNVKYVEE